jgi:hypothetical protein
MTASFIPTPTETRMQSGSHAPWFPLFEFTDFIYRTYQVLPEVEELMGLLGGPVTAKFSSVGSVTFGQAFREAGDRYRVSGWIDEGGRPRIEVEATGSLRPDSTPATFEATCVEVADGVKTVVGQLAGWVFPEEPVQNDAARILSIRGSFRMASGAAAPTDGLGGIALGDVGLFEIVRQP